MEPKASFYRNPARLIVAGMARDFRLYLKEHRKAAGKTARQVAEHLGIEVESVFRQEKEPWRVSSAQLIQWAIALKCSPAALWSPPQGISPPTIDDMLDEASPALKGFGEELRRQLVAEREQGRKKP